MANTGQQPLEKWRIYMPSSMREALPWLQLAMTFLLAIVAATVWLGSQSRTEAVTASKHVQEVLDDKLDSVQEGVSEIKGDVKHITVQIQDLREWKAETAALVESNKDGVVECRLLFYRLARKMGIGPVTEKDK